MREIITLSVPSKTKKLIKKRAKLNGFASVSAYIKFLVSEDDDLISEDKLMAEVKQARKDYREGKAIEADSIEDLL